MRPMRSAMNALTAAISLTGLVRMSDELNLVPMPVTLMCFE